MSSAAIKALLSPAGTAIEIVTWKVRKGSKVDPGSVLMTYKIQGNNEIKKLKSQQIGGVVELLKKEGDTVQPRQQLLMLAGCSHNIVIKELCAECGKDLRNEGEVHVNNVPEKQPKEQGKKASVAMIHSIPELVVTDKHAEEIGKADLARLRKSKKLVLLVDLDQTLIHTTTDDIPKNLKGAHHFRMGHIWYHTKFRPDTERFLQSISKLYELHIVTFGVREYAHTIARIMDKEGKYFSHRILSRDELLDPNTKKANLKSLFPCGEDMVAIIDDREDVWSYSDNVIPVLPYKFFTGTGDINAPNKKLPPASLPSSRITNGTSTGPAVPTADTRSTSAPTRSNLQRTAPAAPLESSLPPEISLPSTETSPPLPEISLPSTESSSPSPEVSLPPAESFSPAPEVSLPSTETSSPAPEVSLPSTESSSPAPEVSLPSTETSSPAPEVSLPSTESSSPAPEVSLPSTESSSPLPEVSLPSTESSSPLPEVSLPSTESSSPLPEVSLPSTESSSPSSECSPPPPSVSLSVKRPSSDSVGESNKKQKCDKLERESASCEVTVTNVTATTSASCIQNSTASTSSNYNLNGERLNGEKVSDSKDTPQQEINDTMARSNTQTEGVSETQTTQIEEAKDIAEEIKGLTERLAAKSEQLDTVTARLKAEEVTNINIKLREKVGEIKDVNNQLTLTIAQIRESAVKNRRSNVIKEADDDDVAVEWADDDTYLQRLTSILTELHTDFFSNSSAKSEKIGKSEKNTAAVLAAARKQVLEGCVLAFSGLFPQSQSLYHSTAYITAVKLGAKVSVNVQDDVTHLVASRLGTKKVRQAATNENCTVVHPDWLWLTWYNLQRENELRHLLTKSNEIPEPPKSSNFPFMCGKYDPSFGRKRKLPELIDVSEDDIRKVKIADVEVDYLDGCEDDTILVGEDEDVREEQSARNFSDTVNPLMTFDNADIDAMGAEIDDACVDDSSSSDSDDESNRDKQLRKKVLSSDENESDSEESLSNDYPKGWGPKNKRQTTSDQAFDELPEEDYMHIQEAEENSPMEINSSSEEDEEDSLMAAQLDKAFLDL